MSAPSDLDPWRDEYEALTTGVGLVELGHRTQIEVSGADRASFLHNLTTNEVRKLSAGAGCETFFTTVQGKTLAHGFVFALPNSHIINTVAGQSDVLLAHLDHYLVSERVTFTDRSAEWAEVWLGGPQSATLLERVAALPPLQTRLAHAAATIAGHPVWLRKAEITGEGYSIATQAESVPEICATLREAGAVACGEPAFNAARIEQGFPWFGVDITEKNLPQEVARDALAISFVKGCYLGQETVARIDALGHVNKTLVGVQFEQARPRADGVTLSLGEEVVGQVTSAGYLPRIGRSIALAYVRRGSNQPGMHLQSAVGAAEVVNLPMR
jgi:folate-binding protein YgfZ